MHVMSSKWIKDVTNILRLYQSMVESHFVAVLNFVLRELSRSRSILRHSDAIVDYGI